MEFVGVERRFSVLGAPLQLECWLRARWESLASPVTDAARRSTINITFHRVGPTRSRAWTDGVEHSTMLGATLRWMRHGDVWWSDIAEDAGVQLRIDGNGADIHAWGTDVWSQVDGRGGVDAPLSLHVAICEALRASGIVPLHAAVMIRDGCATALLGCSGAGKSTTLLAHTRAGWVPLAEDFAWLDLATLRVHAWPGERGVRLAADALARLPVGLRRESWCRQVDGKLLLAYEMLAPGRPMSAPLARMVLLHRGASRAERSVSPRDAARALWESSGVPLIRCSRDAFAAAIPGLVTRLGWTRWARVPGRGRDQLPV